MSTPVKFLELSLRNFMSYGNNDTIINLDFHKPTLIVGRNLDAIVNGQVDSNGAGKSAILDAISFALYDKTISDKDKSNLINVINKKNLEVSLTFEKNGTTYKVIRIRKTKTKADIRLYVLDKNGEWADKTLDSIANNNKEIVKIIGLPFDIFSRIIVFSASFQPFLNLPNRHTSKTSQTSIIEELFGYTELTEKSEALKEQIKITRTDFKHIEELQTQISLEMGRHDEQVEAARGRVHDWELSNMEDIVARKEAIARLSKVNFDAEREALSSLDDAESQIQSSKRELKTHKEKLRDRKDTKEAYLAREEALKESRDKVKLIEESVDFVKEIALIDGIDGALFQINHKDDAVKAHAVTILSTQKDIGKLESQVVHLNDDKCPFCEQTFEGSGAKLEEIHGELKNLAVKLDEATTGSEFATRESDNLAEEIKKIKKDSMFNGNKSDYDEVLDNYRRHKAIVDATVDTVDIEQLDADISTIVETIETINTRLEELDEEVFAIKASAMFDNNADLEREAAKLESAKEALEEMKDATNPHTGVLKELEEIEFDNDRSDDLNELDETLRHQEFLLKLLTKKDSFIRKNLLDRSLPYLNKRLMTYLEQIGLPHRVEFLPDMSAQISQFGTALDFGSLSSGQRARVNLALAFAFRDVLQARYGKISFCMLDECLDTGLGNVGVQLAATMIKNIATENNMSMFVISHRDEIANMFPNKLTVELKNGFSKIVNS